MPGKLGGTYWGHRPGQVHVLRAEVGRDGTACSPESSLLATYLVRFTGERDE